MTPAGLSVTLSLSGSRLRRVCLERALESFTGRLVYTTSPPGFTPEARVNQCESVVDVDAVEGVGHRIMEYRAPGVVAKRCLDRAWIVVDSCSQDLWRSQIARRFSIEGCNQESIKRASRLGVC